MLQTDIASLSSAGNGMRVLIVGPDPLARAGLAALLADSPHYMIVGEVAGDAGLVDGLDASAPDVVVWDLGGNPTPELEHLAELAAVGIPIVALVPDETVAVDALAAGARGLLPRDTAGSRLAATVGAAGRGLVVLDPELAPGAWRPRDDLAHARVGYGRFGDAVGPGSLGSAPPAEDLTPRELEVLQLLAEGLPNKAIAHRLHISEHTAKYHVNAILGKLGAQTRTEAVARAARLGLVFF